MTALAGENALQWLFSISTPRLRRASKQENPALRGQPVFVAQMLTESAVVSASQ
jgi:hypothetical protein